MKTAWKLEALSASGLVLVLWTGCSQPEKRTPITENVIASSYDYTRPVDAAGRSKPVYLQPKVVLGWNKARVTEDGEWIGGHYTATVVEPGRWADLDEAERTNRPYIVPGEVPLIPEMGRAPGPTGGGPSEIDLANLTARVAEVEKTVPQLTRQVSDRELMEAAASRTLGVAPVQDAAAPTRRSTAPTPTTRPAPPAPAPATTPAPASALPPRPSAGEGDREPIPSWAASPQDGSMPQPGQMQPIELIGVASRPVWIPYHPAGVQIEFAVPGRSETLAAEYLDQGEVRLRWLDRSYRTRFKTEPQRFSLGQ